MNEFFKYLLPQLLEYFHNDKQILKVIIPNVLEQQYNQLLLEYKENTDIEKNGVLNERIK